MASDSSHQPKGSFGILPLWAVKLLAALLMAAVCTAGCLVPILVTSQAKKQQRKQKQDLRYRTFQALLSITNCFAAGAFLGLALVHLLPEAVSQLQRDGFLLYVRNGLSDHSHAYNIAYLLAAVGFTAMLALEQILAGGHAHCRQSTLMPVEKQVETRGHLLLPPTAKRESLPFSKPPQYLHHPSHHHARHHLLCTSANFCPGCDDCLDTPTPHAGNCINNMEERDKQHFLSSRIREKANSFEVAALSSCKSELNRKGEKQFCESRAASRETANTSTACYEDTHLALPPPLESKSREAAVCATALVGEVSERSKRGGEDVGLDLSTTPSKGGASQDSCCEEVLSFSAVERTLTNSILLEVVPSAPGSALQNVGRFLMTKYEKTREVLPPNFIGSLPKEPSVNTKALEEVVSKDTACDLCKSSCGVRDIGAKGELFSRKQRYSSVCNMEEAEQTDMIKKRASAHKETINVARNCSDDTTTAQSERRVQDKACSCEVEQTGVACTCDGVGCCKQCGDHSHDPESASRVHSGSIGANVQGGDNSLGQPAFNSGGDVLLELQTPTLDKVCEVMVQQQDEGKARCCLKQLSSTSSLSPLATVGSFIAKSLRVQHSKCGCCLRNEDEIMHSSISCRAQHQDLIIKDEFEDSTRRDDEAGLGRRRRFLRWISCFDGAKWSLAVALGIHALFEGLIVGTTMKGEDVWIATLAILGHKGAEGVALSSTLLHLHMMRMHFIFLLTIFVLASPVGVFIGAFASFGGTGVCGIFNALAVGAVLYATNEMLSEFTGRCSRLRRALKILAFVIGLGMLFGLDLLHAPFCQHHGYNHKSHGHHHH